jgi:hypothetical protein
MVKVGANGRIKLFNYAGSVDLLADVVGYFKAGADPNTYQGRVLPLASPFRLFDTRYMGSALGGHEVDSWDTNGFVDSLRTSSGLIGPLAGLLVNLTATDVTASSYVTAFPSDVGAPTASNLNLTPGNTFANLAVVALSTSGSVNRFSTFNYAGNTATVADVNAVILSD